MKLTALLITIALVGALGFLAIVLARAFLFGPSRRSGFSSLLDEASSDHSTTHLGGPDETPLSVRQITLKICAHCRELIPIAEPRCKRCGVEAATPAETPELSLRIARREDKKPNKAPEPTPRPVTIPAEPGIAPGRVVAHL